MTRARGEGRFSQEVQDAVFHSRREALRLGCSYIDSHHLMLGILCAEKSSAIEALRALGVDRTELKEMIDQHCRVGPAIESSEDMFLSVVAERAVKEAYREAIAMRSSTIDAVHLMLSLLRVRKSGIALLMSTRSGNRPKRITTIPGYSRMRRLFSRFAVWW